eukprot:6650648-Prymnesium_polylepis.1
MQPSTGHVGACTVKRPAFSHGARPRPEPSRAARRHSRSPPPHSPVTMASEMAAQRDGRRSRASSTRRS